MAKQTFDPSNVTMMDAKTGSIPSESAEIVLKETISNSAVMQLAKHEPMTKPVKEFTFLAEGPGAYWVDEGERIQTSKPTWLKAKMEAKKLGVIIPVTEEALSYSVADFFNQMAPKIAEAFYRKFDLAALVGVNSPYEKGISIKERAEEAGNVVELGTNDNLYLDLNDLLASVEEGDHDPDGFVTTRPFRHNLRGAVDNNNLPIFNDSRQGATPVALGLPISYADKTAFKEGGIEVVTGEWDYARYGILQNIKYKIDDSATLTTIKDQDGNPVNLFEREMYALRATMYIGFMTLKEDAFGILTKGEVEG